MTMLSSLCKWVHNLAEMRLTWLRCAREGTSILRRSG